MTKPDEDGIAELFRHAIERKNRAIGTQRMGDLNSFSPAATAAIVKATFFQTMTPAWKT
ncbi:MAG TPA: hypothetical protein VKE24_07115 [Candidatus Acidoferrales bacterium]|nr:hypothetical protein [Candidatus Acidoferrales bacterium]